jgi:hypothetical protein
MTPPDCDLRDYQFMPVDISRLFGSEFHSHSNDAEWRAGVTLWLKSYHQVPAASMPDDDISLARAAEFSVQVKAWKKVRDKALRGWIKCSDGRLYHPVVAEKALEGWLEKLNARKSSGAGNAKRYGQVFDPAPLDAAIETAMGMLAKLNPNSRKLKVRSPGSLPPGENKPPVESPNALPLGSQEKGRDNEDKGKNKDLGTSQAKADKPKRERKVQASLPNDCPTEADRNAAVRHWRDRGRDDLCARLGDEAAAFRDHHSSRGSRMADWPAAWRTWYGNAIKFNKPSTGGRHGGNHKPAQQSALSAISEAFSERNSDGSGFDVSGRAQIGGPSGSNDQDRADDPPSLFGSPAADAA